MPVVNVNDSGFDKDVLQSELPVVVDFWASWCGPCLMAAPVIEELAGQYDGKVRFAKVNVEENNVQPGKYGVMAIPTVILFKGGKEVSRQVGFAGKDGYEKLVKLALGE